MRLVRNLLTVFTSLSFGLASLTPLPAQAAVVGADEFGWIAPQGQFGGMGYERIISSGQTMAISDAAPNPTRFLPGIEYFDYETTSDAFDDWGRFFIGDGANYVELTVDLTACLLQVEGQGIAPEGVDWYGTKATYSCYMNPFSLSGANFESKVVLELEGSYASWSLYVDQLSGDDVPLEIFVTGDVGSDSDTFLSSIDQDGLWAMTQGDAWDPILGYRSTEPFDFGLIDSTDFDNGPYFEGSDWRGRTAGTDFTIIAMRDRFVGNSLTSPVVRVSVLSINYLPPFNTEATQFAAQATSFFEGVGYCWPTIRSENVDFENQCGETPVSYATSPVQVNDPSNGSQGPCLAPDLAFNEVSETWLTAWFEGLGAGLAAVASISDELGNDGAPFDLSSRDAGQELPADCNIEVLSLGEAGWLVLWSDDHAVFGIPVALDGTAGESIQLSEYDTYTDIEGISAAINSSSTFFWLTWKANVSAQWSGIAIADQQTGGRLIALSDLTGSNDILVTNDASEINNSQAIAYSPDDDVWLSVGVSGDGSKISHTQLNTIGASAANFFTAEAGRQFTGVSVAYNEASNIFMVAASYDDIAGYETWIVTYPYSPTMTAQELTDAGYESQQIYQLEQVAGGVDITSLGAQGFALTWQSSTGACWAISHEFQQDICNADSVTGLTLDAYGASIDKQFVLPTDFGAQWGPRLSAGLSAGLVKYAWNYNEVYFDEANELVSDYSDQVVSALSEIDKVSRFALPVASPDNAYYVLDNQPFDEVETRSILQLDIATGTATPVMELGLATYDFAAMDIYDSEDGQLAYVASWQDSEDPTAPSSIWAANLDTQELSEPLVLEDKGEGFPKISGITTLSILDNPRAAFFCADEVGDVFLACGVMDLTTGEILSLQSAPARGDGSAAQPNGVYLSRGDSVFSLYNPDDNTIFYQADSRSVLYGMDSDPAGTMFGWSEGTLYSVAEDLTLVPIKAGFTYADTLEPVLSEAFAIGTAVQAADQVIDQQPTAASPYLGPIITAVIDGTGNRTLSAPSGSKLILEGEKLDLIDEIYLDGKNLTIESRKESQIVLQLPTVEEDVTGSLKFIWSGGTTLFANTFTIRAATTVSDLVGFKVWTKKTDSKHVKIYAKNPVGEGKIQFFFNGREMAWIRAVDETDPKLRKYQLNGIEVPYLVRTVELKPDMKNVFEIYVDGERVWRAAYFGS